MEKNKERYSLLVNSTEVYEMDFEVHFNEPEDVAKKIVETLSIYTNVLKLIESICIDFKDIDGKILYVEQVTPVQREVGGRRTAIYDVIINGSRFEDIQLDVDTLEKMICQWVAWAKRRWSDEHSIEEIDELRNS